MKNTGKEYEQVVQKVFQSILDQKFVKNITVQHDITLQGKSTTHQIDVYWEFSDGISTYATIVQAKDYNSRVSQDKLLTFKGVIDDLPNHPKGIFVTKTGYQKGAKAYAEANGHLLKNRLRNEVRTYNNIAHEYEIPANTSFEIASSLASSLSKTQKVFVNNTEASIQKLADSYQQDLQNLSFEHWGKDRIFGYIENMPIYESCSNTLNLLKEWGFKEFSLNEILSFEMQGSSADSSLLEVQIYAPENYFTGSLNYPSWLAYPDTMALFKNQTAYEDALYILEEAEMEQYYSEFTEILKYARPSYTSKERCYLLVINGAKYLIPEANSDAVEKLISKGSSYYLNKIWNEPSTTSKNAVNF